MSLALTFPSSSAASSREAGWGANSLGPLFRDPHSSFKGDRPDKPNRQFRVVVVAVRFGGGMEDRGRRWKGGKGGREASDGMAKREEARR